MSNGTDFFIIIGGRLDRARLPELLQAIAGSHVSLEWGDAGFKPVDEEELLTGLRKGKLWLCALDARDEDIDGVEAACRKLNLGYHRSNAGSPRCDPQKVDWRPGMKRPFVRPSNDYGYRVFVLASHVTRVHRLVEAGRIEAAKKLLRSLCPDIPRLPAFRLV